jgi:hypothetical protein
MSDQAPGQYDADRKLELDADPTQSAPVGTSPRLQLQSRAPVNWKVLAGGGVVASVSWAKATAQIEEQSRNLTSMPDLSVLRARSKIFQTPGACADKSLGRGREYSRS